jgi:hypothetical protein
VRRFLAAIPAPLRAAFRPAWLGTAALSFVHAAAIWVGMGGWEGLSQPWPLALNDHPLHFHGAVCARRFFGLSGTNAGYDPAFMAGYAASSISNTSTTAAAVVVGLFGSRDPVLVYKLYVFGCAAVVPWLLVGAGWLWRLPSPAVFVAVLLDLIYVWTDFPLRYVEFGMQAFFVGIPLGLLTTAATTLALEEGGFRRWLAAWLTAALLVLVHVTAPLVVAPALGAAYVTAVIRARRGAQPFPFKRHAGFWAIPAVVLALNAFWWLPALWLVQTKGGWDPSFTHPEPVLGRLWQIVASGDVPMIEIVLWAGAPAGVAVLALRRPVAAAGLATFLAAGFFWGYLAGVSRALDPFQPGRQTYALYTAAALAAGIAISEAAVRLRGDGAGRLDRWMSLGMFLLGIRLFGPPLAASLEGRLRGPRPFLSSRPTARLLWIVDRVRAHVKPGERLLYEEGGKSLPGFPDIFHGDRYSGLLPYLTRVEMLGGPFLRVLVKENFTQFGEGRLFGASHWGRDHFIRYARLYRPVAILCWSGHAKGFCRANPDLIEVVEDDGTLLLGRVKGFQGNAIVGSAEVIAAPGRLEVMGATPGVDGTVVLRYHSVPCLRTRPKVGWDSVYFEGDPVPFIRLRPPLASVRLELMFPPHP